MPWKSRLDAMGHPSAFTLDHLARVAAEIGADELGALLHNRKNRSIPHKLATVHCSAVHNPTNELGLWTILGKRQTVYAPDKLDRAARLAAARLVEWDGDPA